MGVVEVDDGWQALLWGSHSPPLTITCLLGAFVSRLLSQPQLSWVIVPSLLRFHALVMPLLEWKDSLSLFLPSNGQRKNFPRSHGGRQLFMLSSNKLWSSFDRVGVEFQLSNCDQVSTNCDRVSTELGSSSR